MADYEVHEHGAVRFYVRPRVMLREAVNLRDVQRLFVLMKPDADARGRRAPSRRIVIGRKRMPDAAARDKEWAYVDRIGETFGDLLTDIGPESYETKTEGFRSQAGAREVARGTYSVARHGDHAHLEYALEEAGEHEEVVGLIDDLRLANRASFIAAVFNPEAKWRVRRPRPSRAAEQLALELDLDGDDTAEDRDGPREPSIYPDDLQAKFDHKRFAPLEPGFLDHLGCEIVLVGARPGHELRIGDDDDGDRSEEAPRLRPGKASART